ncbi:rhamnogalacturonan acetylesterase [Flavobacterium agrisoli]|uniref:Rhamnogalacturonan acetylesterase n=1 Tax=Flavobacterium agrisoli TaxID=2793066 RepID=A0A934PJG8_9FLAO|nr:rhamnogalacturonan acetylesterase [Flavobacterium agrisoli]MBK0369267.1 rhamnogalacturonan acetylesterase [Flavobacterium agrisoli]
MKFLKITVLLCVTALFLNFETKKETKPTVYCVGDSTVKNGSGKGDGGLWGWGDFIGQFLDTTKVSVQNHALGGTSSRSFQTKGLWEPVFKQLKKGDYVLIQFGHNDNGPINDTVRARGTFKGIGNETEEIDNLLTKQHEIVHSYGWYIRKLVKDAKSKGAIPIIFSPIPRNDWKDGKVIRNNDSYGLWAKQIAEQEKVTFIDLNENMSLALDKVGQEKVMGTYFYEKDHTHPSAKGAVLAATTIATQLEKSTNSLKKYLLKNPKIKLPAKKKVFLIGDSTMANNNGNPNAVGWGVAFPKYVDTMRIEVINKARGGRSSRTYDYEGLWKEVREQLQPGNFVIIQFGHNDAGKIDSEKYRGSLPGNGTETRVVNRADSINETVHTFGAYIEKYIKEAREKGAIPIVMSQTVRNEWPKGKPELRDESYNKWSKIAAENQKAPFIDLNVLIAEEYEKLGKEKVASFFPKDHTHTGAEGADFNAWVAAKSIKKTKGCELRDYIEIPKSAQKKP